MRFAEIYKENKFRFSVEVFPPKTEEGVVSLFTELEKLKAIDPSYVSVTYGAMGSTRSLTQDLAIKIHEKIKLNTAFHFTCVGCGRQEIKDYVSPLRDRGITNVVALRGDKPKDPGYTPPKDGFTYANELVTYLNEINGFSIAVAGYPEKHIEAKDLESDILSLKRKVDAGADVIITQLFFDNTDYYRWLEKVRGAGVKVPIIPGIMPILRLKQIEKITAMCGAKIPDDLWKKLKSCGDDEDAVVAVGIEHALSQCRDLIKNKVPGIHFYCLNRAHSVLTIVKGCRDLLWT